MFTHRRTMRIDWGDCDAAGIVFYPRYFAVFDAGIAEMLHAVTGMNKRELLAHYGFAGFPLVDARSRFLAPLRFGDEIVAETAVNAVKRSSFETRHRLTKGDTLCVEGFETRVWVGRDPVDPQKIAAKPLPADLVAKLTAD
jgi:4-hydroxybenzoyl-CoA thioesterase